MVEGLTRYHNTPPSDAIIVHDRQSLNDLVKVNPETILHAENGGYYLKDMEEAVVAITADDLCKELDVAFASIDAGDIGEDSEPENRESESLGGADTTKRSASYSHDKRNKCSHPRCFNSATCLTYSNCHVCSTSTRKVCI
ncbi:uncharacterized protein N7500_001623 [Penicillium coprophilum]|uniref:uncharacterized protein n=1 Tax=Penicillium coprophilum TaxID=36646 RepID=UPI002386B10E|nr:uncharacterized protein N7500_001623 [Penicillium coprophilum]KAJ5173692.1 hypothetical protein N7500_001623 [Penicillium coprophilum]